MELPRPEKLTFEESLSYLRRLTQVGAMHIDADNEKHKLSLRNAEGQITESFRPPLPLPGLPEPFDLQAYIAQLPEEMPSYAIALVQLGGASLGYFEAGEVTDHKVFKKYMSRRKQGRSQISYLKTRGKSKAGSRVRLANTYSFFEEINERLTEWEEEFQPPRILLSCPAQVWGLMFQSKVPPPFDKKDPRIGWIPTEVHLPDHEELLRINRFVQQGWRWGANV
ncbi:MAG: hypothetical protein EAZ89_21695 [Bacteroidetes bacterium]|nr:MAG: hypothetical protein EAZ89_21695 [Bacteroidota bacterium]